MQANPILPHRLVCGSLHMLSSYEKVDGVSKWQLSEGRLGFSKVFETLTSGCDSTLNWLHTLHLTFLDLVLPLGMVGWWMKLDGDLQKICGDKGHVFKTRTSKDRDLDQCKLIWMENFSHSFPPETSCALFLVLAQICSLGPDFRLGGGIWAGAKVSAAYEWWLRLCCSVFRGLSDLSLLLLSWPTWDSVSVKSSKNVSFLKSSFFNKLWTKAKLVGPPGPVFTHASLYT